MDINFDDLRHKMVESQLKNRGIFERNVLQSMRRVPRHLFVPEEFISKSYHDGPIAIGEGQTISQPLIVALMTQSLALKKEDKVLEIGTGSGYQTAILSELTHEVYSVERIQDLSYRAQRILKQWGCGNVYFFIQDGSLGLEDYAPFDAILVAAAMPGRPEKLLQQLKPHGRLIVPIGGRDEQVLTLFIKNESVFEEKKICPCMFVPLRGVLAWN